MDRQIVLVKHAQPVLDAAVPPKHWQLAPEGEEQATRLAQRLGQFVPLTLVSSREPKALRTAGIVGRELNVPIEVIDGLEEFDRPALPLMSATELERLHARIFREPSARVLGNESGAQALARFSAGVDRALERVAKSDTLVVITHGTVISLFVAAHNDCEAIDLWKRLDCSSFVVLTLPDFQLVTVVNPVDSHQQSGP
jgi:broad specificity phosphatase PhoE